MSAKDDAGDTKEKKTFDPDDEQKKEADTLPENKMLITDLALIRIPSKSNLHDRFLHVKKLVTDAIAARKTFMIYGKAKIIRECLFQRGWIEKIYRKANGERIRHQRLTSKSSHHRLRSRHFLLDQQQQQQLQLSVQPHSIDSNSAALLSGIGDLKDEQSQKLLISKMLINHTVDFLWSCGSDYPSWPTHENKVTLFNRFTRAPFTSKIGLCSSVRQMHWYYEPGVANTLFPRCYNICQPDHLNAFVDDFRLTACLSLLKWFADKTDSEGENSTVSSSGLVPLKALDFAIKRCSDYIAVQSHEDIDKECERIWPHQWDQFICWYYKIVHEKQIFLSSDISIEKYHLAAKHILKRIRKYWNQLDMDGIFNIWILKPGNKSRGRGIVLINKYEEVLEKINPANKPDSRFVIQKYIERPLLIYNTKFDIRQWFIVTCAQPLTLWMYRESYLRFCTQEFKLSDLHESVHLSNHAVQCKYKNSENRDPALPTENMWDNQTFKQFLTSQGHSNAWDELIYPGMKQGLVGSLLASQDAMDRRKNSFELYGADFMVMEDFSVWLIEINSHPDMSYSTNITSRMCKQVMADIIKVVIDFKEDKNANTGLFELVYKQRLPNCQPYPGTALSIQGTRINEKKSISDNKIIPRFPLSSSRKKSTASSYIGPVIVDLIEELEIQIDRELHSYYKSDSSSYSSILSSPILMSSRTDPTLLSIRNELIPSSSAPPNMSQVSSPAKIVSANPRINYTSPKIPPKTLQKLETISAKVSSESKDGEKVKKFKNKKSKIQNDEKLIGVTIQNAVNKYKKYETLSMKKSSALASASLTSSNSGKTRAKSSLNPIIPKLKQRNKLEDLNSEMTAIGLRLTK